MITDTQQEIMDLCDALRLPSVKQGFREAEEGAEGYEEYLLTLLRAEGERVEQRYVENRIKSARFPVLKYIEDLDTASLPEGIRRRLPSLVGLDFVREGRNLVLSGNPGTGKTHVATGLGIKACQQGMRVLFVTVPYLVTQLKECSGQRTLGAYERKFSNYDLVIVDELGYVSFDQEGAELFFDVLSLRAANKSTIITSNLSFSRWDEVFGDASLTAALTDRLTEGAILVDMQGESYRVKKTYMEMEQE